MFLTYVDTFDLSGQCGVGKWYRKGINRRERKKTLFYGEPPGEDFLGKMTQRGEEKLRVSREERMQAEGSCMQWSNSAQEREVLVSSWSRFQETMRSEVRPLVAHN